MAEPTSIVSDMMTATVRTLHVDTFVADVETYFSKHEISGAPLIDDQGQLVGFVSKSDVSRFDSTGDDPFYARVHEIANPNVITIPPSAAIEDAAELMLRKHVHHLVVVEVTDVVGILSAFDFVRLVAKRADIRHT